MNHAKLILAFSEACKFFLAHYFGRHVSEKDVSVFHSDVEDPKNNMLTNETIDERLLQVYVRCNKSDVPGG